jgi:hypothetical protein
MQMASISTGMAEAAGPAGTFPKGLDHVEVSAHYRYEYHLSDAFAGLDGK